MPSMQLRSRQRLPREGTTVHIALAHCGSPSHTAPAHFLHGPPQSTASSPWFCAPSLQLVGALPPLPPMGSRLPPLPAAPFPACELPAVDCNGSPAAFVPPDPEVVLPAAPPTAARVAISVPLSHAPDSRPSKVNEGVK